MIKIRLSGTSREEITKAIEIHAKAFASLETGHLEFSEPTKGRGNNVWFAYGVLLPEVGKSSNKPQIVFVSDSAIELEDDGDSDSSTGCGQAKSPVAG